MRTRWCAIFNAKACTIAPSVGPSCLRKTFWDWIRLRAVIIYLDRLARSPDTMVLVRNQ